VDEKSGGCAPCSIKLSTILAALYARAAQGIGAYRFYFSHCADPIAVGHYVLAVPGAFHSSRESLAEK